MKFQGVVLAGGKSSRFGQDKALALIDGVTLLEKAVNLLKKLDLEPVVITNASRDYSFLHCPICRDLMPDKGPLGGLYTACQMFKRTSLLTLTCDMPALTSLSLRTLMSCHHRKNKVTVFCTQDGHLQPFPGVYESSLSEPVFDAIEKGQLSTNIFLEGLANRRVIRCEFSPDVLVNLNDRKEFQRWIEKCDKINA